jgi:hypothetical protein
MLDMSYKPKDSLVAALVELCKKEGGHLRVAKEAKLSTDLLYQIVTGVKLPSGNPKGVGPQTRAALDKRYPGWQMSVSNCEFLPNASKNAAESKITHLTPSTLESALEHLSDYLAKIPETDHSTAAAALAALVTHPERHVQKAALLRLLITAPNPTQETPTGT